jgi:hypothetical protein
MQNPTVSEFPAARVRDGSLPLSAVYGALERLLGPAWLAGSQHNRWTVADRAALAVLMIVRPAQDGIFVLLRMWNDERQDYDARLGCLVKIDRMRITEIVGSDWNPATQDARLMLYDTLCMAADRLAAGALVRLN